MLVSYKKFKVLFCADAEEKNINDFCGFCKKKKKVNIIKVPHHGRIRNEAVLKLLKCFNTAAAIFSCSDKTSALAKVQKNINSFKKENIQVYLTSKHGAVEVLTDGKKCSMATFLK